MLGKGIHKPVQFCEVMEIRSEFRLPSGYYESFREKEDHL